MTRLLGQQHDVFPTHSIFRAFQELRTRFFEIVIVRTAHRDAFALAVLKWLDIRHRAVPVVVIIGPGAACDANRARDLGANAVLPADTPEDDLRAAIARAVASFAVRSARAVWRPPHAERERTPMCRVMKRV